MVKLSEFIGEIMRDIASARTYADYSAAAISEEYHADPFIKGLPIPHYIIDEAEIDVPVMVIGINTQSAEFEDTKKELCETLRKNLPSMLTEAFKWTFINEKRKTVQNEEKEIEPEINKTEAEINNSTVSDKEKKSGKLDYSEFKFTNEILKNYEACIKKISETTCEKFKANLDLYNYSVLKLLEITEALNRELSFSLRTETRRLTKQGNNPFTSKESLDATVRYVSNLCFFDFKKIIQSEASVLIDVRTSVMNEYAQNNCLMHIKLKIKEQDLNLAVEEQNKKEKRYLTLS